MKLTAKAGDLVTALGKLRGISPKSMIPIIGCVRIAVIDSSSAVFSATNLEQWASIRADIAADETGVWCLPAQRLAALIDTWDKNATVTMEDDESEKVKITCGRSRVIFNALHSSDFPETKRPVDAVAFSICGADLTRIAHEIAAIVQEDIARPYLSGVLLSSANGGLLATGAGGTQRVTRLRCKTGGEPAPTALLSKECVIVAERLFRASDNVNVCIDGRTVEFSVGEDQIVSRLIDEPPFDFDRVIAPKIENPAVVNAGELAEVARRCLAVADPSRAGRRDILFRMEIGPERIVVSDEFGSFSDEIECLSNPMPMTVSLLPDHVAAAAGLPEGAIEIHTTVESPSVRFCRPGADIESVTLAKLRV